MGFPEGALGPLPHDPGPHWGEVGIHGLHRPREWDAVSLVEAPALAGNETSFVTLPDGSYVMETGHGSGDVSALARSLELAPPYRVEAVRRAGSTWAVGGRTILVVELPASMLGDEIELVWDGVERATRVGGAPSLLSVSELEALAASRFDTWVVRARRLRGVLWEVELAPL